MTDASPLASDYDEARQWAIRWSQTWFLDASGRDRFQIGGVSAGWATHVDAYYVLLRHAATHWLRNREETASGPLALLKTTGLDRQVRAVAMRWLAPPPRSATFFSGEPAVIVEIPTPSMLEPAVRTLSALGNRASVAASDPRAIRRLRPQCSPVGLYLTRHRSKALVRAAAGQAHAAHASFRRDPPSITFQGRDVTAEVLGALDGLITRSMPWVAPEREAVADLLAAASPSSIAVASDQHRIGRIVAALARERGIPVIVLQHGLPQMPVGLLPVVADTVATWSIASNEWFSDHGTSRNRLRITGNPRLDQLLHFDRGQARSSVEARVGVGGRERLLLALSPTSVGVNRAVAHISIRLVEDRPSSSLIIKLHPGQGNWTWVKGLVKRSPARGRIRIVRSVPLYALLGWATLVLLHRSTVAVEALAAGTPVAVVDVPSATSGADLELRGLDLPRFQSVESGHDWLESEADPAAYFRARKSAIERLAGPVDGRSSARVARLLKGAVQDQ